MPERLERQHAVQSMHKKYIYIYWLMSSISEFIHWSGVVLLTGNLIPSIIHQLEAGRA